MAAGNYTQGTQDRADLAYGPGHSAVAIVPHATNPIVDVNGENITCRAIYVGVSGDITGKVMTPNGTPGTVAFLAVPVGILNVAFTHIHAVGTAATDLVALL
jgi:hypothetical protein